MPKTTSIKELMSGLTYWPAILMYGPLGRGKTAFALTAGKDGIIMDFDRGLKTAKGLSDASQPDRLNCAVATTNEGHDFFEDDYMLPRKYVAARQWLTELRAECKTDPSKAPRMLIIDSFTGLMKACQYNVLANSSHIGKTLTQPEWGILFNEMQNFLNLWKSIPTIHVLLAHEMLVEDADDMITKRILCEGRKFPDQVSSFFDDVFYCDLKRQPGGKPPKYIVTAKATAAITARSRTGFTDDHDMNDGIWPLVVKLGYQDLKQKTNNAEQSSTAVGHILIPSTPAERKI